MLWLKCQLIIIKMFMKQVRIIHAANEAGADAVKLQTYTPDTITIDCDNDYFRIKGTIWEGKNLAISGFPKPKFVAKL